MKILKLLKKIYYTLEEFVYDFRPNGKKIRSEANCILDAVSMVPRSSPHELVFSKENLTGPTKFKIKETNF